MRTCRGRVADACVAVVSREARHATAHTAGSGLSLSLPPSLSLAVLRLLDCMLLSDALDAVGGLRRGRVEDDLSDPAALERGGQVTSPEHLSHVELLRVARSRVHVAAGAGVGRTAE